MLKCDLALKLETEMFMNDKGKVVAELSDEKWLWDLALLCDMRHHFKVNRNSFLTCLGLSELLNRS
jgi:hypothetical protein